MYRIIFILLIELTRANIQLGRIQNANWVLNSTYNNNQSINMSNITCERCLCQMLEMNTVTTSMACQYNQMTCQLVFSNANPQLRIDTSSVMYFQTISTLPSTTMISQSQFQTTTVQFSTDSARTSMEEGTTTGSMTASTGGYNLSITSCWAKNATTIAGSSNDDEDSSALFLNGNAGIRIADNDILYIADTANNRIVIIKLASSTVSSLIGSTAGSDQTQFNSPSDVFITEEFIYVMDTNNYRVQKLSEDGSNPITVAAIADQVDTILGSDDNVNQCLNIFIDNTGDLYVSDYGAHKVLRFPSDPSSGTQGTVVANYTIGASPVSPPFGPRGIFVDNYQTVYIADYNNHNIQKLSLGNSYGSIVAGGGTKGTNLAQLYNPTDILVDSNNNIYIVDSGNFRIVKWVLGATTGVCVAACSGEAGSGSYQLNNPQALDFDSSGSLYVSDTGNNRVQKFQRSDTCDL